MYDSTWLAWGSGEAQIVLAILKWLANLMHNTEANKMDIYKRATEIVLDALHAHNVLLLQVGP